jgi:uncharacterized protein YqcC (DUF446 family)
MTPSRSTVRVTPRGEIPTEIAGLVDRIEFEMRAVGIWGQVAPDTDQLGSALPFCVDTLRFEQWLQWVFLPRMRGLMRNHQPLPTTSAIAPMAQECLAHLGPRTTSLLIMIERFDLRIRIRGLGLH